MRFPAFVIAFFVVLVVSCGTEDPASVRSPDTGDSNIADTPRGNAEAEMAALWFAGKLVAPQEDYDAILEDLAAIRSEYLDSIPKVAIEFFPPWEVTGLLAHFTHETWDKIRRHEPNVVDSLGTVFHATTLDTIAIGPSLLAVIRFEGRLHPERLAEIYASFPEVLSAHPNSYCCDWSNVYPGMHDGHRTYLFRYGYGDCPAGCIDSDLWYFRRVNGQTRYVGSYLPGDPEPHWWQEARVDYVRYRWGK
jgi:hypothetical protein